uniref:Uncharacterized protein LOC105633775 n=1 Tax=Rhizophora mucronata TaxID=61149 RepID=A0A2P2MVQ4_RHIMU
MSIIILVPGHLRIIFLMICIMLIPKFIVKMSSPMLHLSIFHTKCLGAAVIQKVGVLNLNKLRTSITRNLYQNHPWWKAHPLGG